MEGINATICNFCPANTVSSKGVTNKFDCICNIGKIIPLIFQVIIPIQEEENHFASIVQMVGYVTD
jgi:hypothetical protein